LSSEDNSKCFQIISSFSFISVLTEICFTFTRGEIFFSKSHANELKKEIFVFSLKQKKRLKMECLRECRITPV
jgi:hypothetical protein